VAFVKRTARRPRLPREGLTQGFVLVALLVLAGIAVAGPAGLLAWGENARLLEERKGELAQLTARRDELRNRVELLDPDHADPDLVGELLRQNLNVAHPDEIVLARPR
jgi:cell division protein FtsB